MTGLDVKMKTRLLISVLLVLSVLVSTIPAMAEDLSFDSSRPRTEIPVENVCGPNAVFVDGICTPDCGVGTEYVNGVCEIIIVEPSHYVNNSPFYQALLMFSLFLWPYFISGAAIFIVLAKTPRYKKSTRIAVTLFGSLVIVWFLIMMFIGIWPQMSA